MTTLRSFLKTALLPLGSTMYVYGGGWNETDNGAAEECRRLGLDPRWRKFFEQQDETYDFREHRFACGCGLDCSGYVGWVVYNTLEKENGRPGYVMKARNMAKDFASRGWGTYYKNNAVCSYHPGDIMSTEDHVYIVLGRCCDGSILLLHSSPPGVMLSGTVTPDGNENSMAFQLASEYTEKFYPRWHDIYGNSLKGASYLTNYDQMQWFLDGRGVLTDPHRCAIMDPEALLYDLFSERST